jgi:hypothetical protein
MKYLLLFLPFTLVANIWVITTENYWGRIAITKSDYLIISINHSLANHPGVTNRIICESDECINYNIDRLQHKWGTRGISTIFIKD